MQTPSHKHGPPLDLEDGAPEGRLLDAVGAHIVVSGLEQGRNCGANPPQGHGPAVDHVVAGHFTKGVVGNVAVEIDIRLDAPVSAVGFEGLESEEISLKEAAHVVVALLAVVNDVSLTLVLYGGTRGGDVGVIGKPPHARRQDLKGGVSADDFSHLGLEFIGPRLVVEEDDRVVVPAVEGVLEALDAVPCLIEILLRASMIMAASSRRPWTAGSVQDE